MNNDRQCIREIAEGNEQSLQRLYDEHSLKIFNTLLAYTKNTEDAEELLQEVFVTVYHTAGSFQFNSSVSTWMYRIAVNKALDFLRKKNSQRRKGFFTSIYKKETGELLYDQADFDHPGSKLENKEHTRLIFKAIDALGENQKTAFILTQIDGLSQKEVAEVMNISRKSVESLVQRARIKLRAELEKIYPQRGKE